MFSFICVIVFVIARLLIFNILGVTLPSGSLVAELLESRSARVLDRSLAKVWQRFSLRFCGQGIAPVLKPHGSDEKSIAMKVWQVFNILHEEGIFSSWSQLTTFKT